MGVLSVGPRYAERVQSQINRELLACSGLPNPYGHRVPPSPVEKFYYSTHAESLRFSTPPSISPSRLPSRSVKRLMTESSSKSTGSLPKIKSKNVRSKSNSPNAKRASLSLSSQSTPHLPIVASNSSHTRQSKLLKPMEDVIVRRRSSLVEMMVNTRRDVDLLQAIHTRRNSQTDVSIPSIPPHKARPTQLNTNET